ncbi:MAG: D-tyrosyl-tRNA(Tyr) deacylase [Cocleimonas sp.]|nr:D-tyrosyl-tRNA(Tyr) deacylase [Cocleimonas sp.]
MIGLIQRVDAARVDVEGLSIAQINGGILLFLGVEREDAQPQAMRLVERVIGYRIFEDETGRMNKSLKDIQGELLIVPQFTLVANTQKGTRPSFASAAKPDQGRLLFDYFTKQAETQLETTVQSGKFGADMQVSLINNGPATFWLKT